MTQKQALDILLLGKNVFLTGQAGSGKTFLLNKYIAALRKNKIGVAVTASTGIAATHLGGMTIHSWSGIGIKDTLTEPDLKKVVSDERIRDKVLGTQVLIIDEISMLHSYRLDMVNQICQLIRRTNEPFGGIQVIVCGDFFQLPPVRDDKRPEPGFAFKAQCWQDGGFVVCYLEEQHRQLDDEFARLLNGIRSSEVDEFTFEKLGNRLNRSLPKHLRPTRLYTHNVDVDTINGCELETLTTDPRTFSMTTRGDRDLVRAIKRGCLAPEELILKAGAFVMFIKNNPAKGYVNGTLGTVKRFTEEGNPVVLTHGGDEIVVLPARWALEDGEAILAEISQMPLRLAWAITVHKSQGMTLDAAEIDLSKSFAFGMGYVALSRVRSLEGIRLLGINQHALLVDQEISEIDKHFKKLSNELAHELKAMDKKDLQRGQKQHLQNLLSAKRLSPEPENSLAAVFEKLFEK